MIIGNYNSTGQMKVTSYSTFSHFILSSTISLIPFSNATTALGGTEPSEILVATFFSVMQKTIEFFETHTVNWFNLFRLIILLTVGASLLAFGMAAIINKYDPLKSLTNTAIVLTSIAGSFSWLWLYALMIVWE